MKLHVLSARSGGAAENMAVDFLLLQRYPEPDVPRFRHYEWRAPAFTFGYGQKIEFVRGQIPAGEPVELCRRPTGGGVVDHRHDWTYALVIPRRHALWDARATESYRLVHEALARALRAGGQPAELQPAADEAGAAAQPGVCFARAEIHDVIDPRSRGKIAGAAQKRNKHGLLLQGSIDRAAAPRIDWERFGDDFCREIASVLGGEAMPVPWPEIAEHEVDGMIEQYSAPEWNEMR
jgi:lipoate-protein ligase A